VESTQATGSPVEEQGASAEELWATYEGLMAEHAEHVQTEESCWSAWRTAAASRNQSWDAATAAYAAWNTAAGT